MMARPATTQAAAASTHCMIKGAVPYRTNCGGVRARQTNARPYLNSTCSPDTMADGSAFPPAAMTHKPKTVLVIDDDEGMRGTLGAVPQRDHRASRSRRAAPGRAARPVLNREDGALIMLDVRLPGVSGFEVLRIVKENYSLIEAIMISAINDIETAVQAMKHGAYHYVTKDFDYDQLRSIVRNASERQDLNRQVLTLSAQVAEQTEREVVGGAGEVSRAITEL